MARYNYKSIYSFSNCDLLQEQLRTYAEDVFTDAGVASVSIGDASFYLGRSIYS